MRKSGYVVNRYKFFSVLLASFFILFLFATEGYAQTHTITATAGAGGTITPSGAVPVPDGADQSFIITPDPDYDVYDVYVDSVPQGPLPSYTFFTVTGDHTITAAFDCLDPVRLDWDDSYHAFIMDAYGHAVNTLSLSDFTIQLVAGTLAAEDLLFDADVLVRLEGGYDCSFLGNSQVTAIPGSVIIAAGTLIPSNIGLSGPPPCLPGDPNNFPGNPEICDGLDNNCNGLVDDGLSFDDDNDGSTAIGSCGGSADDCDDNDPHNFPGNPEICDGQDNNCDTQIDEGLSAVDVDGDGFTAIGSCGGTADDCNDNNSNINPDAVEIPHDGIDQDCNGQDLIFAEANICSDCHGPAGSWNNFHNNVAAPDGTCADCHVVTVINVLPGHYGKTVRTSGNNMTAGSTIVCISCHDWHEPAEYDVGNANIVWAKVTAAGGNVTCDTCHENRAAVHATGTAHDNRLLNSECNQCHPHNNQTDIDTLHEIIPQQPSCLTCHKYTGTKLNAATVAQAIQNGLDGIQISCLTCHGTEFAVIHAFLENHVTHTSAAYGPQLTCTDCHISYNPPLFTDGQNLTGTTICDTCHSADGVLKAKAYWFTPGSSEGTAGSWAVVEGEGSYCGSCHDESPGNTRPDGGGDPAGNVIGDNSSYGFYVTGHGLGSGNYPLMYYQEGAGTGNPAANRTCSSCHQFTAVHFNSGAKRLLPGYANDQTNANCNQCHPPGTVAFAPPELYSGSADYEAAGHGTNLCSACHEVHGGISGAYPAMAKDDGRALCLSCHYAGNPGGLPVPASPPAAHEAGSLAACSTCHNPHQPAHGQSVTGDGCVECHGHDPGTYYDPDSQFPYSAGDTASLGAGTIQSHSTHTEMDGDDIKGPAIYCDTCHDISNFPYFNSGTIITDDGRYDLAETDVCNDCHSPGGSFDGVNDANIGAKNNWDVGVYNGTDLKAGKERWCVGCHDSGMSVIPVGGRQAPDVAGNNTSYGYYVSGHGAAATECGACHGLDMDHNFDNRKTFEAVFNNYSTGFRLKPVNGQEPMVIPVTGSSCYYESENYRLCYSCHDEKTLLNDTRDYGVYGCASNPYNSVNDPTVTEITTFFRNEQLAGGVHPVNLHWDHLADADKGTESFQGMAPLWFINGGRSRVSCSTCHNPHGDFRGADIPTTKMTHGTLDIRYDSDANGDFGFIGSNANFGTTCTLVCHFEQGHKWYRNESGTRLDSIDLADIDPVPAAAEAGYTNDRNVLVSVIYNGNVPTEMIFAEDPTFVLNATGWIPFSSSYTYNLSETDGSKTVYCRLRNASGNSEIQNSTIELDTIPPSVSNSVITSPNGGEVWLQDTSHDITWSQGNISDQNLKVSPLSLDYSTNSGSSFPYTISTSENNDGTYLWTVPPVESSAVQVRLTATDKAGNKGADSSNADFTINPITPVLNSIALADNNNFDPAEAEAGYTNSQNIAVTISAGNNPTQMILAEDSNFTVNSTGWIPFSTPYNYSLSIVDGGKTVYCRVKNWAGESGTQNDSIILDTTAPAIGAATLTAPNGSPDPLLAEFWEINSSQTITWISSNISDTNLKTNPIILKYSLNGGVSYNSAFAANEANDGSYTWNPLPSPVSPRARVRLIAADKAGNQGTDDSDDNFNISPPDKFIITSTGDANTPGTLRYALNNLEDNAVIWFKITATTNQVAEINITSSLPPITYNGVTIAGNSQGHLVGSNNPNGPEVRVRGPGPSSGVNAFALNASNGWIESLQISGVNTPVSSSSDNSVVLGCQLGFGSDDNGYFTAADLRNGKGIILSSASSQAYIGAGGANANYISCTDDSGVADAGVNNEVWSNIFGILPDDTTECPNLSGNGTIYLNGSSGAVIYGNTVCGGTYGLNISYNTSDTIVKANLFGIRKNGSGWIDCADPSTAIYLQPNGGTNNVIGGANMALDDNTLRDSNVIDPSTAYGIRIRQTPFDNSTRIYGNFIGTNPEQTETFAGGYGIYTSENSASRTLIGGFGTGEAGNVIANMTSYGIYVDSGATPVDYIGMNRNVFFNNGNNSGDDAIFLGSDENHNITRPIIDSATTGLVTVSGVGNGDLVEIYIADFGGTEYGEGKTFAGSAVASGGTAIVPVTGVNINDWVTATRTRISGSLRETSAFSSNYQAQ